MTYEILQDIPAPAATKSSGRTAKYPFATLEPGQCFFVPLSDFERAENAVENVRAAAGAWRRRAKLDVKMVVAYANNPAGVPSVGVWKS